MFKNELEYVTRFHNTICTNSEKCLQTHSVLYMLPPNQIDVG